MPPNTNARGTITLTNTSAEPVTLLAVTASCKCTTTTAAAGVVIEPGKSFDIQTELSGAPMQGARRSQIKIVAQGFQLPLQVPVEGEVSLPVRAVPAYINLVGERSRSGQTVLESTDGAPFRVLGVNGQAPPMAEGDDANTPQVRHTLAWSFAPDAVVPDFWLVETDHPKCALVDVRVRNANSIPRPVIKMREYRINAGRIDPKDGVVIEVATRESVTPFTAATMAGGEACAITAELVESRVEDGYTVASVKLIPRAGASGFVADRLRVTSGAKTQDVELFGTVRPATAAVDAASQPPATTDQPK